MAAQSPKPSTGKISGPSRDGRIAVLGAGGFLGSHIVPALRAALGCEIDAVDVNLGKLALAPDDEGVRRVTARLDQPGLVDEITGRCGTVISLTALCNPALYSTRPLEVIDANYTELLPLVKACAARGNRLIHFSTCEVYGRRALDAAGWPMDEMSEDRTGLFLGPVHRERWTYACAKQLLERVIWAHGRHGDLAFTIIRPFNVIGPRMDFLPGIDGEGVPRVLASFMNALLRGQPLPLVEEGRQRRTFISVHDFVEGVVRVVERPGVCRGEILNLGNPDNDVTIRELGEALARAFAAFDPAAAPARFQSVPARALYGDGYDDTDERIPDLTKARRLLHFHPQTTLAAMLPEIVADYAARYRPLLQAEASEARALAARQAGGG
ncbi:MAG TPA: NAD-dependent epimerase/dehydratase family protein [Polyangia bacterium]|nr:NAD-dependent epimerase/dehydratase family protein [Polyangia bacterium]